MHAPVERHVFASLLSGVNDLGIITRPTQDFRIRQMIVHDHVCLLDAFLRAQRNQAEIAGSGANKKTFPAAPVRGLACTLALTLH